MTALLALAERVEGATGADRDIDGEIDRLMHSRPKDGDYLASERAIWRVTGHSGLAVRGDGFARDSFCARDYTRSFDAVRTLMDPTDEWELTTLYNIARATVGLNRDHQTSWPGHGEHKGADPVLALLAACLRALDALCAAREGGGG